MLLPHQDPELQTHYHKTPTLNPSNGHTPLITKWSGKCLFALTATLLLRSTYVDEDDEELKLVAYMGSGYAYAKHEMSCENLISINSFKCTQDILHIQRKVCCRL